MTSSSIPSDGSSDDLEPVLASRTPHELSEDNDEIVEEFFDDEYEDDEDGDYEFDDEYDDEEEFDDDQPTKKKKSRRRIKMHCFNCNRQEGHFLAHRGQWFFSYFQGMTFGVANLIGPFKCQCCGHNRLMCRDWLSLRKWFLPKGKKSSVRKPKKRSRSR